MSQYLQPPTQIGQSTPFPGAPPKGKTFVATVCDNPQCASIADGMKAAATALGWDFKTVPFQLAAPQSLVAAMTTALQYHPVAVSVSALPEAVWQSEVPAYAAAHVAIITDSVGPTQPSPVVPSGVVTSADGQIRGKVLAAWFISASNGHGHALVMNIPDVPVLDEIGAAFKAEVSQNCPGCSVKTIQVSLPQFSTDGGVAAAVSAVQRDTSIKYVITEQANSDQGLPVALSGAGLSKIQIAGAFPDATALGYLRNGTASGFVNVPLALTGWMKINIAALYSLGITPATAGLVPLQFLTKSTVTPTSTTDSLPANYQAQYKALWHVGE